MTPSTMIGQICSYIYLMTYPMPILHATTVTMLVKEDVVTGVLNPAVTLEKNRAKLKDIENATDSYA